MRSARGLFSNRWLATRLLSYALVSLLVQLSTSLVGVAADPQDTQNGLQSLDRSLQKLKQDALEINGELLELEEALLYPPEEQLVIFVSLTAESAFKPKMVQVEINGEMIVNHQYSARDVEALRGGGVQRLHVARLPRGEHVLAASLVGLNETGQRYRCEGSATLIKNSGPSYIEVHIEKKREHREPTVTIAQWYATQAR